MVQAPCRQLTVPGVLSDMMVRGPQAVFNDLYNTYPEFRQLADSAQNQDVQQAYAAQGYDFNAVRQQMGQMPNGLR